MTFLSLHIPLDWIAAVGWICFGLLATWNLCCWLVGRLERWLSNGHRLSLTSVYRALTGEPSTAKETKGTKKNCRGVPSGRPGPASGGTGI